MARDLADPFICSAGSQAVLSGQKIPYLLKGIHIENAFTTVMML